MVQHSSCKPAGRDAELTEPLRSTLKLLVLSEIASQLLEQAPAIIEMLAKQNRQLAAENDYLLTENRLRRDAEGNRRLRLSDDQRRLLAVKGKLLGRKRLGQIGSLFTPDTILRWHRQLVARHHTHAPKSTGRPPLSEEVIALVIRLAKENSRWGCDKIAGEMKKLGHNLSDTSVENILKKNGFDQSNERHRNGTSWAEFLQAHWQCLAAIDFTTVDVWTPKGLKTIYLLFAMRLATRQVQFLGSTANPNEAWMATAADRAFQSDGILHGEDHPTILLMDRDTKYTASFKKKLKTRGVKPQVLPRRSPNMNAYIERFMLSYKTELARRMIFFGKRMLDHATGQYLIHYHTERPHQGLENELIIPLERPPDMNQPVRITKRLGGLLKSYHRRAA